jgi:hypothetical protein
MRLAHILAAIAVGLSAATARASEPALVLEGKIALGRVSGRIDHLAVDLDRQRLFVAELGNDAVGVVDLKTMTTLSTLTGFREPQGIGYVRGQRRRRIGAHPRRRGPVVERPDRARR